MNDILVEDSHPKGSGGPTKVRCQLVVTEREEVWQSPFFVCFQYTPYGWDASEATRGERRELAACSLPLHTFDQSFAHILPHQQEDYRDDTIDDESDRQLHRREM